ncbi:hypothetical protein N7468_007927 [Penicillium chermesinum]|uniref:Uncharacterized protein n=1 Tax=Penicillium chermesinum TaxID=63820 RepID=A0A9W9TJD2_9EURO|nr:uncharacterized protein N7468_007927 [Penicillium chermesinum]KAJ5223385.1 hypothetical protein N7468_007927 [Penicillium chermesinum]
MRPKVDGVDTSKSLRRPTISLVSTQNLTDHVVPKKARDLPVKGIIVAEVSGASKLLGPSINSQTRTLLHHNIRRPNLDIYSIDLT